jgi:asparagine synthase (glutamine-hydrolysing)
MKIGNHVIIFNGEIYNHKEVRKKYNLTCKTNSDTETTLEAFRLLGPKCLDEFDGMFAFAIYNESSKQLFLARDRAGKKPLYFFSKEGKFVFSSELKALSKAVSLKPDLENIDGFFKGAFIGDKTAYDSVKELEAGCFMTIDTQSLEIKKERWWDVFNFYSLSLKLGYREAKENVKLILDTAVKRRIESSDLEVGTFLSGGIDSGLITYSASKINKKIKSFTISVPGNYDESPLARSVANKLGTEHHEILIDFNDLKLDFEGIIGNYGEPFVDSSAIPSYYVSKAAKQYVTVVLNGDGADELFGGYRRYGIANYFNYYNNNKATRFFERLSNLLPFNNEKKSYYNYLYRLIQTLGKSNKEAYWSVTTDIFQSYPSMYVYDKYGDTYIEDMIKSNKSLSGLKMQMALDFNILLTGILLKKIDIATMAHSLEARSPFLCKEFLELIPSFNDNLKIKGFTSKFLLRDIAKETLPSDIHSQPKRGFEIPLKNWINNDLKDIVQSYLNTGSELFVSQFIHKNSIDLLLENKAHVSAEVRAKMIYQLLVTEIWAKNNGYI